MSLQSYFSHIKFFQNKELNQFYVSISIMSFAEGIVAIFVPVYLYQLNYPIYTIIFYFFLVSFFFVIFSYLGAQAVSKIGIKHSMLASTPFAIAYYIGLKFLPLSPILFFILPLFLAFRMILFNYGYHLNFIIHSDRKLRGRQLSIIGILNIAASILSPLAGGFFIFYFGFLTTYIIVSILLAVSTIPLFLTIDRYEEIKFDVKNLYRSIFNNEVRGLTGSFAGYAIESIIGRIIWPIFLIILLLNTKTMGIIITFSMIISVAVFYLSGKATDKYSKAKLLRVGTILYFFSWIGRIFANSSLKVLFIDSYKNISEKILHVPWQAFSYDLAQKGDYFKFIVTREIIFNLTRIVLMPILILFFYFDLYPFLLSFLIASIFSLFYVLIIGDKNKV